MSVFAAVQILAAISEAIRDLGSVPSGHLYAHICGIMTLDAYQNAIGILKRAGLVKEDGFHVLTWTGPKIETSTTTKGEKDNGKI